LLVKELSIRRLHWLHLANTTKTASVLGGSVALCQIALATYYGGGVVACFIFPSITPYTSLFSISTLVYLQHIHGYVQYRSTRSTSILITFSLFNTLIHIVLSISPHPSSSLIVISRGRLIVGCQLELSGDEAFDIDSTPHSFVFASKDWMTTEDRLLVLIHGSGVVRAGQWARRCCSQPRSSTLICSLVLSYIEN